MFNVTHQNIMWVSVHQLTILTDKWPAHWIHWLLHTLKWGWSKHYSPIMSFQVSFNIFITILPARLSKYSWYFLEKLVWGQVVQICPHHGRLLLAKHMDLCLNTEDTQSAKLLFVMPWWKIVCWTMKTDDENMKMKTNDPIWQGFITVW